MIFSLLSGETVIKNVQSPTRWCICSLEIVARELPRPVMSDYPQKMRIMHFHLSYLCSKSESEICRESPLVHYLLIIMCIIAFSSTYSMYQGVQVFGNWISVRHGLYSEISNHLLSDRI